MDNSDLSAPTGHMVDDGSIGHLQEKIAGEVILPGNPVYDAARNGWNKAFDHHPRMIVRCLDTSDVVEAVRFATKHSLPVAVRSGGHSPAGMCSVDDGLVIDLSGMTDMTIDPERRVATARPGLTWGGYGNRAQEYGLATPSGDSSSVGVGGLTLGGGIGWLVRKYGMTIDHLLSVEVVTADGTIVTASDTEHSDLFWAVRGGGGNFGVVTRFEFRLVPVGTILAGALIYPADPAIVTAYIAAAQAAPDELTTYANLMFAPPLPNLPPDLVGKPVIIVPVCYTGDLEEGKRVLEPLRAIGPILFEMVGPMPYPAMFRLTEEGSKSRPTSVRTMFMDGIDSETAGLMVEWAGNAPSPMTLTQIRVLGGAMSRVPNDATAFAYRDKTLMFTVINPWDYGENGPDEGETARHRDWTRDFLAALKSHNVGAYVNFLGDEGEEGVHEAYPSATYRRLTEIKRRYDPTNLFRANRNIAP